MKRQIIDIPPRLYVENMLIGYEQKETLFVLTSIDKRFDLSTIKITRVKHFPDFRNAYTTINGYVRVENKSGTISFITPQAVQHFLIEHCATYIIEGETHEKERE